MKVKKTHPKHLKKLITVLKKKKKGGERHEIKKRQKTIHKL